MRPPRLRCTLFSLIYPPHLLGSYKRQLYGFVLFSRLTKRNLASYVISVRRTKSSLTASFRFYLTIDTLAVQLYTSLSPRRVRDFHPLERAHGAQTKISCRTLMRQLMPLFLAIRFQIEIKLIGAGQSQNRRKKHKQTGHQKSDTFLHISCLLSGLSSILNLCFSIYRF